MKKGFTLIELLVALAIMGILMGISITVYVGVTKNASRSAVTQNFNKQMTDGEYGLLKAIVIKNSGGLDYNIEI